MVETHRIDITNIGRWSGLLALSCLVNIYALTYFSLSPKTIEFPSVERIKVTILSIAAPTITPVITPPEKIEPQLELAPAPAPEATVTKIHVDAKAPEKIFASKPKSSVVSALAVPTPRVVKRKPILKKIVKEIPILEQKTKPKVTQVAKTPIAPVLLPAASPKIENQPASTANSAAANKGDGKDASTVVHNANYRKRTAPRYPRRAFELGQQGVVTLAALILPNGYPQSLKIEKSSGHRLLDKAAISAVKKWEFEPLVRNGQKIQSWVRVPVRFVIN